MHQEPVNPRAESRDTKSAAHSGSATRGRHRFSDIEIEQFLRLERSGIGVSTLCARYGFTLAEFFRWKARFTTDTSAAVADELAALRTENQLLRELVASLIANTRHERHHVGSAGRRQDDVRGIRGTTTANLQYPQKIRQDSED